MPLALVIVLLPCLLLALPVILPVVAILEARDRRRRQRAALRFHCLQCGAVLGPAALDRADAACRAAWAEQHERYPHVRLRMVRRVWAICVCGAGYDFDKGAFQPEPVSPSASPAVSAPAHDPGPAARPG